jgi:2-haloacid dehalogenase
MSRSTIFFDINETLLDLAPLRAAIGTALGGRNDLLDLWFTTLLHHSLVATVTDRFRDFDELATVALSTVAARRGLSLSESHARNLVSIMRQLPPQPDAAAALQVLRDAGLSVFALSNSSTVTLHAQLEHARLASLFTGSISVEQIGLYKPHRHVYRWAARQAGAAPETCWLVAAHEWDTAGALQARFRAAHIHRMPTPAEHSDPQPQIVARDLLEAARRIVADQPGETVPPVRG